MTIRVLTTDERTLTALEWPEVFDAAIPIPPDGLIRQITDVGCVFAFEKTTGDRLYILVDDVWPTCTRQALPAPAGFWDDVVDRFAGAFSWTLSPLVWLAAGFVAVLLFRRSA